MGVAVGRGVAVGVGVGDGVGVAVGLGVGVGSGVAVATGVGVGAAVGTAVGVGVGVGTAKRVLRSGGPVCASESSLRSTKSPIMGTCPASSEAESRKNTKDTIPAPTRITATRASA